MNPRPATRTRLRTTDDGFALLTVLGTMVILTVFGLSTLAYAINNSRPSRDDQDAKAALAAAQAGVEDYLSRLNIIDDTYFDNEGVDPSNPAFDGDGDGYGMAVPGTSGKAASFRYTQLTTAAETGSTGVIRLKVTGTSGRKSRDLLAEISPDGFVKYIYFTDLESADPRMWRNGGPWLTTPGVHAKRGTNALQDSDGSITGTKGRYYAKVAGSGAISYYILTWTVDPVKYDELCAKYWHAGRNAPTYTSGTYYEYSQGYDKFGNKKFGLNGPTAMTASSSNPIFFVCQEIQFTTGDEINGPLHTNDAMQIQGPALFRDERTESSWDTSSPTNTATPNPAGLWWGSGTPDSSGHTPHFAPKIAMPSSNDELIALAQPASPDSPERGCLYTGDTRITFVDNAMKVLSPLTATSVPRCYNTTTPGVEQTVDIPPVIYVENASSGSCSIGAVGYPKPEEKWGDAFTTQYDCKKGNAFVSGRLSGRVTVATRNDVVIVGDTTYKDGLTGTDALGLIPTEYAWVYHPVKDDGSNLLADSAAPRNIDAAILSVKRSFLVQNVLKGAALSTANNVDDGTKLKVRGAIAQKHRGPVGSPGGGGFPATGYVKLYLYDERLKYSPPPYFLKPDKAPWRVTKVTD
jgi:hypothetical protein